MTLDKLCAEALALPPRAARMAEEMLGLTGPMSAAWNSALAESLGIAAHSVGPFTPNEVADVLHAAIHPDSRADWLREEGEFVLAHRFAVNAHLAAEKWKSIVMTLLEGECTLTLH